MVIVTRNGFTLNVLASLMFQVELPNGIALIVVLNLIKGRMGLSKLAPAAKHEFFIFHFGKLVQ
jgi:hypothetical protein